MRRTRRHLLNKGRTRKGRSKDFARESNLLSFDFSGRILNITYGTVNYLFYDAFFLLTTKAFKSLILIFYAANGSYQF